MFISHKNKVIQHIHDVEWQCRRNTKGQTKAEYWVWLDSITDADGVADYSGETGYTIVECTDENIGERVKQLNDYIAYLPDETIYNIKWSDSKVNCEETLNVDGDSHDPKQYVQSHLKGDDTAKDARLLADKWVNVRRNRDRKLAETDYLALSDQTLSGDMETYRQELRDVPSQSDPDDITWPTKPS